MDKLYFNNGISTLEFFIMQKNLMTVGDTPFEIAKVLTLQQTVEFTYIDASVKMVTETTSPVYFKQILVILAIHH